jgi:prolipoprotein diacylglyceryltransferase
LPWAIRQHGALRHPTQIYMSLAAAAILAALLWYSRRRPPENALFYMQGTLYCILRFVIEFFRAGPRLPAGLTVAQIGCLAGFGLFAGLFVSRVRRVPALPAPAR